MTKQEAIDQAFDTLHGDVPSMYSHAFTKAMKDLRSSGAISQIDKDGNRNFDQDEAKWAYELLNQRAGHRETRIPESRIPGRR